MVMGVESLDKDGSELVLSVESSLLADLWTFLDYSLHWKETGEWKIQYCQEVKILKQQLEILNCQSCLME